MKKQKKIPVAIPVAVMPTEKPLLFLHVGIPKTGSTALQIYFSKYAHQLLQSGLYYPDIDDCFSADIELGLTSGNAISLALLYQQADDLGDELLTLKTKEWIASLIEKGRTYTYEAIILSCEQLSSTLNKQHWRILEAALSEHFALHVVLFTREPYSWVFSTWLQCVKRDGVHQWLGAAIPERDFLPLIMPALLSEELGKKTIQLSYEACRADLTFAFFNAIGFAIPDFDDDKKSNKTINPSLTDKELTIMLLINQLLEGDASFGKQVCNTLIGASTDQPCYFYSPEVDSKIDDFFRANNVERQDVCREQLPLVHSEASWIENNNIDAALLKSFFVELAVFTRSNMDTGIQAEGTAGHYRESAFRTEAPDNFNAVAYLCLNRDVLVAKIDPYKHYVLHGLAEGRQYADEATQGGDRAIN